MTELSPGELTALTIVICFAILMGYCCFYVACTTLRILWCGYEPKQRCDNKNNLSSFWPRTCAHSCYGPTTLCSNLPRTRKRNHRVHRGAETSLCGPAWTYFQLEDFVMMQAKAGDLMAFTYWATVDRVRGDELDVKDVDNGNPFSVRGRALIDSAKSADFFEKEEKITRTAMAELLIGAKNIPFTVCFDKQDGDERVLRGRLISHEALLGRSSVEDLDVTSGNRMRLVDHRTLKWLILNGVRYSVKK